ncbi:MAG: hypothetical protein GYB66_03070, partial [Chloroflexi bacterium]|nr:hypothetical protein [Chloroflexota bacterium]
AHHISTADWFYDQPGGYVAGAADNPVNDPIKLPYAYSAWAQCPDTNIGGGIRRANDALTNVATIRRDAVWVMIVLSDGEANRTDPVAEITEPSYGSYGFCPWDTFCIPEATWNATWTGFPYPYADPSVCPADTSGFNQPWCNDDNPDERHFCLRWSQNPDINGRPDPMNPNCGERGDYDADDFARDWSDFAGLIEVADGVPGNFIAIFTIGFGDDIVSSNTAAPLLRYVADAGDNGFIDNDMQQDLRDNGFRDFSVPGDQIGEPGPCEGVTDPEEWCGQYYYASDLSELEAVFEAIASRLFTRLSR